MSLFQLLLVLWLLAGGALESGLALGVPAVVTRPGYAEASGEAHSGATVTVNGQSTSRLGAYFHKRVAVDNTGAAPVETELEIEAAEGMAVESGSRTALTLPDSESPEYDDDGNLMQDARWTCTWDAADRLTGME